MKLFNLSSRRSSLFSCTSEPPRFFLSGSHARYTGTRYGARENGELWAPYKVTQVWKADHFERRFDLKGHKSSTIRKATAKKKKHKLFKLYVFSPSVTFFPSSHFNSLHQFAIPIVPWRIVLLDPSSIDLGIWSTNLFPNKKDEFWLIDGWIHWWMDWFEWFWMIDLEP